MGESRGGGWGRGSGPPPTPAITSCYIFLRNNGTDRRREAIWSLIASRRKSVRITLMIKKVIRTPQTPPPAKFSGSAHDISGRFAALLSVFINSIDQC